MSVDRLGNCPNCKEPWDGGDIRFMLGNMDIHQFKSSKDVDAIAADYGWTPENGKRFSRVKVYEITMPLVKFVFLECPDCLHVYDEVTEEHHRSISLARDSITSDVVDEIIEEE